MPARPHREMGLGQACDVAQVRQVDRHRSELHDPQQQTAVQWRRRFVREARHDHHVPGRRDLQQPGPPPLAGEGDRGALDVGERRKPAGENAHR